MEIDDSNQQTVVELSDGDTLLLAGPGCGKTYILAKRVFYANAVVGVPFAQMLNVTFTNHAAREMNARIADYLGYSPEGLFVGNMHRFCLRFLHQNRLIPADTSVLDEDDQLEFLLDVLRIPNEYAAASFLKTAAYLYQTEHDHPEEICRRPPYMPSEQDYQRYALYKKFKADNHLIDFDEILLRTYTALMDRNADRYELTGYTWIQVDETQDMTPLQLAIIDRLSAPHRTSLYLGDEQQAIFSFLGAGGRALDSVKRKCRGHVMRLQRNYRSPDYLVNLCNDIASTWMHIDSDFLPRAVNRDYTTEPLSVFRASENENMMMICATARRWLAENPEESVLVLTNTNAEGDAVSEALDSVGLSHFHISKQDVFHQVPFRTVWSHLAVTVDPLARHPWVRILYQTGAVRSIGGGRALVGRLRANALSPDELLHAPSAWRIPRFCDIMSDTDRTVVVFDTETTGLDVFEDDIIQIAAVKMRGGEIVDGSRFEVFVQSDRPIPQFLGGGVPNSMVEAYAGAEKLPSTEAFALFRDYVGNAVVAGHNIDFDCAIMRSNIGRCGAAPVEAVAVDSERIDSLLLSRLLFPHQRRHTLAAMIEKLGIEGSNSHNACDDVAATALLLKALLPLAQGRLDGISAIAADRNIRGIARRFQSYYGRFYYRSRLLLTRQGGTLSEALANAYDYFTREAMIDNIPHFDYFLAMADNFIAGDDGPQNMRDLLSCHLYELTSFNESDLFAYGIVNERLSVMTIHKAKGLEADNVMVYNSAPRRRGPVEENARLLYVAFSRARRRLRIGLTQAPNPILQSVLHHFTLLSPSTVRTAVMAESLHRGDRSQLL